MYWLVHLGFCQAQPRPMQGLLIIHVYQNQNAHTSTNILYVFVPGTALNCTYRYGLPAELQNILFPSGNMSGTQTASILLGPDKSKLGRVEVEACRLGRPDDSGHNEKMKQGWHFLGSPAHHCIRHSRCSAFLMIQRGINFGTSGSPIEHGQGQL